MSLYDVRKVQISSMLKVLLCVFAILGIVIGLITFFLFPTELATGLSIGARFLSWLIFVVIYTVIMLIGTVVVAWLYNLVVGKLLGHGIIISLEPKE
jgi:hypothetical protein